MIAKEKAERAERKKYGGRNARQRGRRKGVVNEGNYVPRLSL